MIKELKKSVVYEIYPKSFCDSDGDGLGDLKGVVSKLEYLKTLGIDYIWLTPFVRSPQRDNGYDISDYYKIDERYGTMEDFDVLCEQASKRGIKLMMDMVLNHVSAEHPWFQKALQGNPRYMEYFIFKKGKADGGAPTNWTSKFGGSAWEYVECLDLYYLHLFDVSQPDLNWENPEVRKELQKVVNFWLNKGVKGLRFDVINLISKGEFLDDESGDGRKYYTDGPRVHEYIRELNEATFGRDAQIITVGEMNSTSMEHCFQYAGEDTNELSMVFNFHHMKVDYMGIEKWVLVPYDFMKLKGLLFDWQIKMREHNAWNAVFWCNHDQPRVVSRFGDEGKYRKESAKMLATAIHCLRGTPYIYQGEELGMTNAGYTKIEEYRDVESLNHFGILQDRGISEQNAYAILGVHSRDNSRTPMQWDDSKNAGFTSGMPWIEVNRNHTTINAAQSMEDKTSVFHYYRKLIQMRKDYDVIAYGEFSPLAMDHETVFAYERILQNEKLVVICNFYGKEAHFMAEYLDEGFEYMLSNYEKRAPEKALVLKPYEALIFYKSSTTKQS